MKKFINKIFLSPLLLVALFILSGALTGSYAEERIIFKNPKAKQSTGIGIRAVNERLVASDVTSTKPFWCGPGHMLAYSKRYEGLLLQNVDTGEVITVSDNAYNRMVGCTNDGKWFVYRDTGFRYKESKDSTKFGYDIVRYEVATGRRQVFAIAYDASGSAFSPLDDSIYLAGPHPVKREMPEPKWNIIWSGNDKAGILRLGEPPVVLSKKTIDRETTDFSIDILKPERRSLVFRLPGISGFRPVLVDGQDRFYLKVRDGSEISYVRCSLDIEKMNLKCKTIFKNLDWSDGFDVFKDGKTMLLLLMHGNCLRVVNIGSDESYCITESSYRMGGKVVISPDESMVVFEVIRDLEDGTGAADLYITDILKSK